MGLLGADRSDGADTVLVGAAGDINCLIALQSALQHWEEREGWTALRGR